MQALVFTAPGEVRLASVDEPTPAEGEVIVSVVSAGICGSELHGVRDPGFRTPPLIMGHELVGVTPEGRRVAVDPLMWCGSCLPCRGGRSNLCERRRLIGVHRPGGFAPRVAVPRDRLFEVPEDLSWERASIIEPIANAVHAWGLASPERAARIGVIGAGTIGLVCAIVASLHEARVSIADPSPGRLAVAGHVVAGATTAAELSGTYDVVFEAVGMRSTRTTSLARLAPGGQAIWLGLADGEVDLDARALVRHEQRIMGSFAYTDAEFQEAVALASRVDAGWVRGFPLAEGDAVFGDLLAGSTDVVKAVLLP